MFTALCNSDIIHAVLGDQGPKLSKQGILACACWAPKCINATVRNF